jgi:hypothetical protein
VWQGATCETNDGAERPIVHVIPPPPTRIPLGRLDQSPALLRLGYEQARSWLEENSLPRRAESDLERDDGAPPPDAMAASS